MWNLTKGKIKIKMKPKIFQFFEQMILDVSFLSGTDDDS